MFTFQLLQWLQEELQEWLRQMVAAGRHRDCSRVALCLLPEGNLAYRPPLPHSMFAISATPLPLFLGSPFATTIPGIDPGPLDPGPLPGEPDFNPDTPLDPDSDPLDPAVGVPGVDPGFPAPSIPGGPAPVFSRSGARWN